MLTLLGMLSLSFKKKIRRDEGLYGNKTEKYI